MDWIPAICTLLGAGLMIAYRTIKSMKAGEAFDPTKFGAALTTTATLMSVETYLSWGDAVSVQGPGIIQVCLASFLVGWGGVYGTSQLLKVGKNG